MANRDTFRYTMRDGNQILKFGVTDDPERREKENQDAGIDGDLRIEGPRVTRQSALEWEREKIEAYRQRHGRNPPWNDV